ncbi:MAG TPA: flagellar hook-length control protein FliK [Noviherbaspirillum sp.]|nr:flagellar hook-length control protein FliK [Noviherbaspirillum sp.]
MLSRAELKPTRPPGSLESSTPIVSSTDPKLEVLRRLNQIGIGREMQAVVESALDDGTYLVKVSDAMARMALPVGTKVGDTLSMVFVAKEPRPTFLLTQQGSSTASLSTTARLIDHLLHAAQQEGAPTSVDGKMPLLASGGAFDPKQLAAALQKSLGASGLFYESHLHDWISGTRPLADLKQEPQARFATAALQTAEPAAQSPGGLDINKLASHLRELGLGAQNLANLISQATRHPGTDADLISQQQLAPLPTVEPEIARLINLQLNTLEHQQFRWHGELWPGRPMEWEVTEDKQGGEQEPEEQSSWTSVVRFELPHLGDISATIRLAGDRVHVQVNTADDNSAATLRAHGNLLADALEAAGAPLDSLLVKRNEPA